MGAAMASRQKGWPGRKRMSRRSGHGFADKDMRQSMNPEHVPIGTCSGDRAMFRSAKEIYAAAAARRGADAAMVCCHAGSVIRPACHRLISPYWSSGKQPSPA